MSAFSIWIEEVNRIRTIMELNVNYRQLVKINKNDQWCDRYKNPNKLSLKITQAKIVNNIHKIYNKRSKAIGIGMGRQRIVQTTCRMISKTMNTCS